MTKHVQGALCTAGFYLNQSESSILLSADYSLSAANRHLARNSKYFLFKMSRRRAYSGSDDEDDSKYFHIKYMIYSSDSGSRCKGYFSSYLHLINSNMPAGDAFNVSAITDFPAAWFHPSVNLIQLVIVAARCIVLMPV